MHHPQPRVNLDHLMRLCPLIPRIARLFKLAWNLLIRHNFAPLFDGLDVEACRHVPGNVAVEAPYARIVGFDLDHDEAEGCHGLGVTTGGVARARDLAVPGQAVACSQDEKVVAWRR
jgi:hypothetical protein